MTIEIVNESGVTVDEVALAWTAGELDLTVDQVIDDLAGIPRVVILSAHGRR